MLTVSCYADVRGAQWEEFATFNRNWSKRNRLWNCELHDSTESLDIDAWAHSNASLAGRWKGRRFATIFSRFHGVSSRTRLVRLSASSSLERKFLANAGPSRARIPRELESLASSNPSRANPSRVGCPLAAECISRLLINFPPRGGVSSPDVSFESQTPHR